MRRTAFYRTFAHTKFAIIGGGTGGLNLSSHLLRSKILPNDITIFDQAKLHYYQPGWTMLGAGLCDAKLTYKPMQEVISKDIKFVRKNVAKVDAENNQITLTNGQTHTYDHLVFSSGLKMDWDKIKGAKQALDNPNSKVGSIYDLAYAQKMKKVGQQFKGGHAIFTEPVPPIKCAGAPQKVMYLWTDKWTKAGIPVNVSYIKAPGVMFGVPKYAQALTSVAAKYSIQCQFKQRLVQVKERTAIFQHIETKQQIQKPFDFLHVIPPMSAHNYIAESGLADEAGYLDVDKYTLRHNKYRNIWGLGDCTSTPNSKTAAAVFSQTETLVKNIKAQVAHPGCVLPQTYEGYASCPLFVGDGKLILAEFKYGGIVDETFFSDQQKPRRLFYWLKRYGFPHIYWNLVPRGLWGGRKGIKIDI